MDFPTPSLYASFTKHSSADRIATDHTILDLLRQVHADCTIKHISVRDCDLLGFAKAGHASAELITEGEPHVAKHVYHAPKRRLESSTGYLDTNVTYGRYKYIL